MIDDKKDSFLENLGKLQETFQEAMKEMEVDHAKRVEECDYETKLAITAWVMKNIVEHASEGGSYRYLIYERLGFGMDAYAPLLSDGMTISNEFDLGNKEEIIKIIKENGYDKLKPYYGLCDEPDCYDGAGCGFPTDDGYRHACYKHWREHEIKRDYNA